LIVDFSSDLHTRKRRITEASLPSLPDKELAPREVIYLKESDCFSVSSKIRKVNRWNFCLDFAG